MDCHETGRVAGVLLAVALVTLLLATGAYGLTAMAAPGDDPVTATQPGHIDDNLANATGEVEVLVVFAPPEPAAVSAAADPTAALKSSADERFAPLHRLADADDAVEVTSTNWLAHAAAVTVDTDETALAELAALPGVVAVEADHAVFLHESAATQAASAPTPQSSHVTYGLEQIRVPAAWDTFDTRGAGVAVAVLDTGADGDHPDIDVAKWKDFAAVDPSDEALDYGTHGTHVAGTLSGGDASGTHIGVAPEVDLYVGAVLTEEGGAGSVSQAIDGMAWAVDEGADIISLSLGSEGFVSSYINAVQNARAAGVTVVAASGNSGDGTASSPANVYGAVSVGATQENENVAGFSSGIEVDTDDDWGASAPSSWPDSYIVPEVSAPGQLVYSALPGGSYGHHSGTSMATPHVAGVAALLQSATDHRLDADDMLDILRETARHPDGGGQDTRYGHGIVDAEEALLEATGGAVIAGTVTDAATGEPVGEVAVTAEADDGSVVEGETSAQGAYSFPVDSGLTYTVTAERHGYDSATESVTAEPGETMTVDLAIAGDAALEVTVDDEVFGVPIEDAAVTAAGPHGTYPATHEGDGLYRIESVPSIGIHTVDVSVAGYADHTADVDVDTPGTTAITAGLVGDATLEVAVSDAVTEGPIEGASLVVERDADGATATVQEPTDADGTATVTLPGTGATYAVDAEASGYQVAGVETTLDAGASASTTIVLTGDTAIVVSVSDALFGGPVDDATVAADGPTGTYPGSPLGDGRYEIESVPSQTSIEVETVAAGYLDEAVTITADGPGVTPLDVALDGDATLEVTVTDRDGDPVDGARITITNGADETGTLAAATGGDGTVEAAVPGTDEPYDIAASADRFIRGEATTDPVPAGGHASVRLELTSVSSIPGLTAATAVAAILGFIGFALVWRRQ